MPIAIMSDIHANRQALEACLSHAREHGAERFVFLGDYVGYGGDPEWTVTTIMELVNDGAIALRGNHDSGVALNNIPLFSEAQIVTDWTRGQLDLAKRKFLADLPLAVSEDDRLYVHAEASAPEDWNYVISVEDAARSMMATKARLTFCGHVHQPAIYGLSSTAKVTSFTPTPGAAVPLLTWRRWLVVLGSVGQPRNDDPAASYAIFDTSTSEITFQRVPYDIEAAADAIRENDLPNWFAERLFLGE
jgi:diadenosine tetraphosphatase ApaH/serine/threonine PP2A family protein phosphatase